jgi:hypothetical protein
MNEMKEITVQQKQDGRSSAKETKLPLANRSPITVQTFELDGALEIVRRDHHANEELILYRPSLPIRYVDRDTFERMR